MKVVSREIKAKALKAYGDGTPIMAIAKEAGVGQGTISSWAHKADIGRNRKRKPSKLKRSVAKPSKLKRSPLDGQLRFVAELVTAPGLNNNQRIKMISAYLSER